MSKENNGGPAFPSRGTMGEVCHEGMTLRDYFAAKELSKMTGCDLLDMDVHYERVAKHCYKMADAMLTERKK